MKKNNDEPIKSFRDSGVSVSVWENQHKNDDGTTFVAYSIKVQRSYKDDQGTWQNTEYFRKYDCLVLASLLFKAHTWIGDQSTEKTQ